MSEADERPREPAVQSKSSEAIAEIFLLSVMAWVLFFLVQAPWYMPTFNVEPYGPTWFAVSFVAGVVPTLAILLVAFGLSWLVGLIRGRVDMWRCYQVGLIVAFAFTLLVNFGIWYGQSQA